MKLHPASRPKALLIAAAENETTRKEDPREVLARFLD
jgi:hypothetical protein